MESPSSPANENLLPDSPSEATKNTASKELRSILAQFKTSWARAPLGTRLAAMLVTAIAVVLFCYTLYSLYIDLGWRGLALTPVAGLAGFVWVRAKYRQFEQESEAELSRDFRGHVPWFIRVFMGRR